MKEERRKLIKHLRIKALESAILGVEAEKRAKDVVKAAELYLNFLEGRSSAKPASARSRACEK